jgi:arylsulfatase A-like enzyme
MSGSTTAGRYRPGTFVDVAGRLLRRPLAAVLVLVATVAALTSPSSANHRFSDLNDASWAAVAATWAFDQGIVTGLPGGRFGPNQAVTRAQVVSWLWNEAGQPPRTGTTSYSDVGPNHWAGGAIGWAGDEGIVSGFTNGTFLPNGLVNRGQLVLWLWRQAGMPQPTSETHFSDLPPGSVWARAAGWATENGIASGFGDGTFRRRNTVTRGLAVVWLHRRAQIPAQPPPNVLVILTDDQTLASLAVMPAVTDLIGAQGTTFTNAISTFPLCCPARATHASGQYSHNHGVVDNDNNPHPVPGPPQDDFVLGLGGYDRFDHTSTVATWVDAAGYETSYVGKTLNDYDGAAATPPVPPGYDRWFGYLLQNSQGLQQYFNYEVYVDEDGAGGAAGGTQQFGNEDEDYLTDVLADRADAELTDLAGSGDPWFLTFAPYAPHAGTGRTRANMNFMATPPAPRHVGAGVVGGPNYDSRFDGVDLDPTDDPAFDEADLDDKAPWVTSARQSLASAWNHPDYTLARHVAGYRQYLESLLAVDDAVARLVATLEGLGELENTIVLFTSDNGYQWGEHGFLAEKNVGYEESLHVPLLVRGPGFPAGVTVDAPVGDIDHAPTFVRATGADAGLVMDGLALQDIANQPAGYDDRALAITNWPTITRPASRIRHWEGVRTARYTYLEAPEDAFAELYDRQTDPEQLESVAGDAPYAAVQAELDALLDQLLGCAGTTCDRRFPG